MQLQTGKIFLSKIIAAYIKVLAKVNATPSGGRVKECGKPVPTLVEPHTFVQWVLKEEHSNQTSGHGAGI